MQDLFFIFSHSLSPCLPRCLEAASRPPFNYTKINVVFPSLYLKHGKIIYYVSNTVLWKELAKYSLNVGRFAFFFLLWELCGALDSASPYKHVHFFITSADETSGYTYVIIICFAFSCVECLTEIKCVNQEGKCSCFWPINNDLSSKKNDECDLERFRTPWTCWLTPDDAAKAEFSVFPHVVLYNWSLCLQK